MRPLFVHCNILLHLLIDFITYSCSFFLSTISSFPSYFCVRMYVCVHVLFTSLLCVHLASLVLPLLACFTVCFKLFDRDSDGRISWTEFVDVITCYLSIQEENKPPNGPLDSPEVDTILGAYVPVFRQSCPLCVNQCEHADVLLCMQCAECSGKGRLHTLSCSLTMSFALKQRHWPLMQQQL